MVDLLRTLHFRRVVRVIARDDKGELEGAALVHSLVRVNSEREVEDIIRVGEIRAHGATKGQFAEI